MAQKTYQRVASKIEDDIRSGRIKPLSRLPAERDLAADFEVSRTTVREALLALEAAQIIKIKDRSGAYVLPLSQEHPPFLSGMEEAPGPHEVLQMRRLIEGEACLLVAMNGSASAIEAIIAANEVNAAVPPDDTPEFHEATRAFHMAIVHGAENSLFAELLEFLWAQKTGPLWENWYAGTKSRRNRLRVIENNQEITDAIVARRPQAARTAMQHHIDWMIARFLSY